MLDRASNRDPGFNLLITVDNSLPFSTNYAMAGDAVYVPDLFSFISEK